jgi:hypothetical protein
VSSLSLSRYREDWCNWHIDNLTSEATAHKINSWL